MNDLTSDINNIAESLLKTKETQFSESYL